MMAFSWRVCAVAAFVLGLSLPPGAWSEVPNDETPGLPMIERDPSAKEAPPEPDKPTLRLQWQRQAWGLVTPTFRANTLNEARMHYSIKNARGPKWVSIGPSDARYAQNHRFTGFITDSGRAILPHPTNPDVVYFLTSGGGLNRMAGWPDFSPVSLNLGTFFANQNVKLRFRIGADESTGAPGWEVTDINVSGITDTPFAALLPHAGTCPSR